MSILIRKGCQDLLDDAGLSMTHVGIESKTLCIVGECGQPILHINGIKFDTTVPKKAEIAYAIELFEAFLTKHKEAITNFIKAKREFNQLDFPEYEGKADYHSYQSTLTYSGTSSTVKLFPSEEFIINNILTLKDMSLLLAEIQEFQADAKPFFDALSNYKAKEKELNAMQSALNKCDI